MSEIRTPNVVTEIPNGKFVLKVYAYRKLTDMEKVLAAREYLKRTKRRSPPTSGTDSIVTTFGHDGL